MEGWQSRDGPDVFQHRNSGRTGQEDFQIMDDMSGRIQPRAQAKPRRGPPNSPFNASNPKPATTANGQKLSAVRSARNAVAGPSSRPTTTAIFGSRKPLQNTKATRDRRNSQAGHSRRNGASRSPDKTPGDSASLYRSFNHSQAGNDSESRSRSPEKHRTDRREHEEQSWIEVQHPRPASTANNRRPSPEKKRPFTDRPRARTPEEETETIESFESRTDEPNIVDGPHAKAQMNAHPEPDHRTRRRISVSPTKRTTSPTKFSRTPHEIANRPSSSPPHITERRANASSSRRPVVAPIPSSYQELTTSVTGATFTDSKGGHVRFCHVSALHISAGMCVLIDPDDPTYGATIPFGSIRDMETCRQERCPSVTMQIQAGQGLDRGSLAAMVSGGISGDAVQRADLQQFSLHMRLQNTSHSAMLLEVLHRRFVASETEVTLKTLTKQRCDHYHDVTESARKFPRAGPGSRQTQTRARSSTELEPESGRAQPPRAFERSKVLQTKATSSEPKGKGKAKVDSNQSTLNFGKSKRTAEESTDNSDGLRRSSRRSNVPVLDDMDDIQESRAGPSRSPAIPAPADRDEVLFPFPLSGRSLLNITKGDKWRVETGQYLNDTLLEWGLRHMLECTEKEGPDSDVHLFNSFFYQKLGSKAKRRIKPGMPWEAYDAVRKWTKGTDVFAKNFVIVPINEDLHWYLAVIYNPGALLRINLEPTLAEASIEPRADDAQVSVHSEASMREGGEMDEEAEVDLELGRPDITNEQAMELDDELVSEPGHETVESVDEIDIIPRTKLGRLHLGSRSEQSPQTEELPGARDPDEREISARVSKGSRSPVNTGGVIEESILLGLRAESPPAIKSRKSEVESDYQILNNEKCWIFTFDSLGSAHVPVGNTLARWLVAEAEDKKGVEVKSSAISYIHAQVPLQDNDSDCGLFLVHYATQLIARPDEVLRFIERRPVKASHENRQAYLKSVDEIWGTKDHVLRHEWQAKIESLATKYRQMQRDEARQKSLSAAQSRSPEKIVPPAPATAASQPMDNDPSDEQQSTKTVPSTSAPAEVPEGQDAGPPKDQPSDHVEIEDRSGAAEACPTRDRTPKRVSVDADGFLLTPSSTASVIRAANFETAFRDSDLRDATSTAQAGSGAAAQDVDEREDPFEIVRSSPSGGHELDSAALQDDDVVEPASADDAMMSSDEVSPADTAAHQAKMPIGQVGVGPSSAIDEEIDNLDEDQPLGAASHSRQATAASVGRHLNNSLSSTSAPSRLVAATGPSNLSKVDERQAIPPFPPLTSLSASNSASDSSASHKRDTPFLFQLRPTLPSSRSSQVDTVESPQTLTVLAPSEPGPSRTQTEDAPQTLTAANHLATSEPGPSRIQTEHPSPQLSQSTTARQAPPAFTPTRPPWFGADKTQTTAPLSPPRPVKPSSPAKISRSKEMHHAVDISDSDDLASLSSSDKGNDENSPPVQEDVTPARLEAPTANNPLLSTSYGSDRLVRPKPPVHEISDDEHDDLSHIPLQSRSGRHRRPTPTLPLSPESRNSRTKPQEAPGSPVRSSKRPEPSMPSPANKGHRKSTPTPPMSPESRNTRINAQQAPVSPARSSNRQGPSLPSSPANKAGKGSFADFRPARTSSNPMRVYGKDRSIQPDSTRPKRPPSESTMGSPRPIKKSREASGIMGSAAKRAVTTGRSADSAIDVDSE